MPEQRSITIREAQVADAGEMGHFMVRTWLAAHRDQLPAAAWERRRLTWTPADSARGWLQHLEERDAAPDLEKACCLVAEDANHHLVGLVAAAAVGPVGSSTVGWERLGEVGSLYVDQHHQRRGIGARLLRQVAVQLHDRGVTRLEIAVLDANQHACRFYESLGGRWVGNRLFDEDGDLLPERLYSWPDISTLLQNPRA